MTEKDKICNAMYEHLLNKDKFDTICERLGETRQKVVDKLKINDSVNDGEPTAYNEEQQTIIRRLENKIKELNNNLKDLQDDLEDKEDELKRKNKKNNELVKQVENCNSALKKQKNELAEMGSNLHETEKNLQLKIETLSFVQEVVSAKPISNESAKGLYTKVDAISDFIQNDIKDCLKSIEEDTPDEIFGAELRAWSTLTKKSWINRKTTIAFVGEFSAGKTSIVNRILSQDNPNVPQLPVKTEATTAIPTYITGGASTSYNFVTPDNVQKYISESTFKKVTKEVLDQVKGISSIIKYFVMTYKNENLNNLSILDTPGFNSTDKEDAERTIDVINECDALFWVFDVNVGTLNKSSIQTIKNHLRKPIYVVINKTDTKSRSAVDDVEKLIKDTLSKEGVRVNKFLRFSKKAKLEDIMNPIMSVKHDSDVDSYLSFVEKLLKSVSDKLQDKEESAKEEVKKANKGRNDIEKNMNKAIEDLFKDCEKVADKPHVETRKFRKDVYKMTKDEYQGFITILDRIANKRIYQIEECFKKYADSIKKSTKTQEELDEIQNKRIKVESVKRKFEFLEGELNKTINRTEKDSTWLREKIEGSNSVEKVRQGLLVF